MSLVFVASSGNLPAFSTWVPQPLPLTVQAHVPLPSIPLQGSGSRLTALPCWELVLNVLKTLMVPWGFSALLALSEERVLTGGLCTHCGQPGPSLWTWVRPETGEPRTYDSRVSDAQSVCFPHGPAAAQGGGADSFLTLFLSTWA